MIGVMYYGGRFGLHESETLKADDLQCLKVKAQSRAVDKGYFQGILFYDNWRSSARLIFDVDIMEAPKWED